MVSLIKHDTWSDQMHDIDLQNKNAKASFDSLTK